MNQCGTGELRDDLQMVRRRGIRGGIMDSCRAT